MTGDLIHTLVYRFMIGGFILSGATFLANYSNPLIAGILVTIPLELVSLFFVKKDRLYPYARSILIMSIATVVPVLYYNIIHPLHLMPFMVEVFSSFFVWFLVGTGLYYTLPFSSYGFVV